MNAFALAREASVESGVCPYCKGETAVHLPGSYKPVFEDCAGCGKTFIAERLAEGFQVFRRENAPCCSDPDCREIEMGGGDEE